MNEQIFQNTTINQYLNLLKTGQNPKLCGEISDWLNSRVTGITGGFDLHLFQMQKELLLISCKHFIAYLEFDEEKKRKYQKRIEQLRKEIKKKTANKGKEETDPYKSFLEWLFTLKKYYGSEVDREQTLIELVVATEQMMKFYQSQNEIIEKQKSKK